MSTQTQKRKRVTAVHSSDEESGTDYERDPAPAKEKSTKKKGKGKQKRINSEASEEEEEEEEGPPKKGAISSEEKDALVQAITRFVLFNEANRKSFTRQDLTKAVLKDGRGKYYNELMTRVQKSLRTVLGMEIVQLRTKEGVTAKSPVKAYVLRSIIPLELIAASTSFVGPTLVVEPERGDGTGGESSLTKDLRIWEEDVGTARDLKREGAGAYGILGVILGIILVNGKTLTDEQLRSYMKRLNLHPDTPTPLPLSTAHPNLPIHSYLSLLQKQGYLERTKPSATGQATQATQKSRKSQIAAQATGVEDIEIGVEWRWGARSEIEFGEEGIARFVREIFLEKEIRGKGKKEREEAGTKVMGEIQRAAGTALVEAKSVKAAYFA